MNGAGSRRLAAALAIAAAAGAAVAQAPLPVPPPQRFEYVLWCSDLARGSALAKANGFTAVQVGRDVDPAPATNLGLGFYLDQPIGKGLLELRDAQWTPVRDAYEKTRDPAVLVRPGCFAAPDAIANAAAAAAAAAARVRGPQLRFVALADEASATRHDAPLDTCRCAHCAAAFRAFAERRFGTLDACNEAFGVQAAKWVDVVPLTTDQIRRRELGDTALPRDLRAWSTWLDFVDEQFAQAVTTIAAATQAAVPGVPVGLTGMQVPAAFGGNDPSRYVPALSLIEPYAIGGAVELARWLAPKGAHCYMTLAAPADAVRGELSLAGFVQAQFTAAAAAGLTGAVVWNDAALVGEDGALSPFGRAVTGAMATLGPVLDACAGATIEPSPVWLVESQPAVRAWWMIDSARDGMTWVRRLPSHEREHSTSQAARLGWLRALQDLGLQPRFVGEAALPERLLRERPRVVVLPAMVAMADRTAQALIAYARSGGVVLADHSTGLYDETLLRREHGALDALFGISARSLRWEDLWVREGQSTSREAGLPLAEAGLRGQTAARRDAGDAHVEQTTGRGRAVYLNAPVAAYSHWRLATDQLERARELRRRLRGVLHEAGVEPPCEVRGEGLPTCIERTRLRARDGRELLAVRVHALDAPSVLHHLAREGARAVRLELPAACTLRPLGGESLGHATGFDVRLDALRGAFFEVVR